MSMAMLDTKAAAAAVLVAGGLIGLYLVSRSAKGAAKAVGEAVNPVSQDNIFNRGFEAVGSAITGDPNWSLGGMVSDWVYREEIEAAHAPVSVEALTSGSK